MPLLPKFFHVWLSQLIREPTLGFLIAARWSAAARLIDRDRFVGVGPALRIDINHFNRAIVRAARTWSKERLR